LMLTNKTPKQTGRVASEGDSLYYEVRGSGQPLIFIAGAGGDGERYAAVAKILADEYKVITYDRRANSHSSMNEPQNFEISQQSRDVVAVLHAAGEESAFVFGNSSGAVIALDVAKTQPQAARAVIVHEPPLVRVHNRVKKWQRFYASVYLTGFLLGTAMASVRFMVGSGLPVRQLLAAARAGRSQAEPSSEPLISARDYTEFLIKQELLPVTNYMPDLEAIKKNGVWMFMAAGKESLDKKRWYAETAQIMAKKLPCEMLVFPGHHGSFMDMPVEWAPVLRRALQKAAGEGG
jgi:pimeloyl-ACP methyl ester carboxylesterase